MPAHEVWKRLQLARSFDHPQAHYSFCHLRQCARNSKDQVGVRYGEDGRDEERDSECDVPFKAECSERPVDHGLMAIAGEDHRMRQL